MGSIDMLMPLSTVLSSAVNKSQQHQETKILGNAENQWVRTAKRESIVLCSAPSYTKFYTLVCQSESIGCICPSVRVVVELSVDAETSPSISIQKGQKYVYCLG